jgi:hypothetical protein
VGVLALALLNLGKKLIKNMVFEKFQILSRIVSYALYKALKL